MPTYLANPVETIEYYMVISQPPTPDADTWQLIDEGMAAASWTDYILATGDPFYFCYKFDPTAVPGNVLKGTAIDVNLYHLGAIILGVPEAMVQIWSLGEKIVENNWNFFGTWIKSTLPYPGLDLSPAQLADIRIKFDYMPANGGAEPDPWQE